MFANIFPIELEFDEFQIQRLSYTEENLKTLRLNHNSTHSFFKNEEFIYISNKSGEDLDIGTKYNLMIYEQPDITVSLMRHIFFKTFLERFPDRTPLEFHPFRFLSTREADAWIYSMIPDNIKNKLGYKKVVEIQIKYLDITDKRQFYLILNIERKWIFNID